MPLRWHFDMQVIMVDNFEAIVISKRLLADVQVIKTPCNVSHHSS